jgi:hypothetical protein
MLRLFCFIHRVGVQRVACLMYGLSERKTIDVKVKEIEDLHRNAFTQFLVTGVEQI